jgi:hypothetical protein
MTVSLEDSCQKSSLLQEISTLRHELERLKTLAAASPTSGNPDRVTVLDEVFKLVAALVIKLLNF